MRVEWIGDDSVTHRFRLERDKAGDNAYTADTAKYTLREPFNAPAVGGAAAEIFKHAAQFKIDEFAPGIDSLKNRAALDRPVMTVRILLKDGKEHVVTAGGVVNGLYRYVRHPTHPDPVRVFYWRFNYFKTTAEELVDSAAVR